MAWRFARWEERRRPVDPAKGYSPWSGFTLTANNVETGKAALTRFFRAFVSASTFRAIAGDSRQAENALEPN
jgi:hypothetical protein